MKASEVGLSRPRVVEDSNLKDSGVGLSDAGLVGDPNPKESGDGPSGQGLVEDSNLNESPVGSPIFNPLSSRLLRDCTTTLVIISHCIIYFFHHWMAWLVEVGIYKWKCRYIHGHKMDR